MFRQSLNLPARIIRKSPVNFTFQQRQLLIRLYRTSTCDLRQQIEGDKQECPRDKKSGRGFYYTLGAVLIGTGAVVAYAKHDEDFRAFLRDTVPGSDQFISMVTWEETNPIDFFIRWVSEMASLVRGEITEMFTGESSKGDKGLPPCDEKHEPYVPPKAVLGSLVSDDKTKERRTLKVEQEAIKIDPKAQLKEEKKLPEVQKILLPDNLKDLEAQINISAKLAVNSYTDAVCALRDLAEEIFQLVEKSVENVDPRVWTRIKKKTEEKEAIVAVAEEAAKKAESVINQLKGLVDDPKFPGNEETKSNVRRNIRRIVESVDEAKATFKQEMSRKSVTNRYWSKVQEARMHFSEELETLFPNVRLNEKKIQFAEGEIDLFILYAFQNILFYQKELSKLDTLAERRLQEALLQSKVGDPQAIDAAIDQEIEKERRKICLEFQKKMLGMRNQCEQEMRTQMKRQAEAHADHVRELVEMKDKEVEFKVRRSIEERLETEKIKFKEEVATMVARLKGFDDVLKCRAKAEARMRASQALWSACQALDQAVRDGPLTGTLPPTELVKPLEDEISAIIKSAAKDDELVDIVVSTIPLEARVRGVYTESVLKERFISVERVAKRVALLPEGGASLPLMLLSYLQSFLILDPVCPIPQHELANEPVEVGKFNTFEILQRASPLCGPLRPLRVVSYLIIEHTVCPIPELELANEPVEVSKFNTFEIIQRARYWVDRGNIAQALRYMNLLSGASHVVSLDWCKEARIFLETQQAALALMTHAAAAGLAFSY